VQTFAQEKDAVDPQTLQQLGAKSKKYDEAVNNNDAAAVAAHFTEDAIFVTDTGLLYGRQGDSAIGSRLNKQQV
jgi:ketosteroid isomerase-like protein